MASLKFFLVAALVAVASAEQVGLSGEIQPQEPVQLQGQIQTGVSGKAEVSSTVTPVPNARNKKDVLLSTVTYPYVLPTTPLLRTISPINYIHPYYRSVYPYTYYPYAQYYPYSYYPNNVVYLKK